MSQMNLIRTRNACADDYNFVKATWIRALRFGNPEFSKAHGPSYYKAYSRVIDRILSLPETSVRVACLDDAPDVILGYVVHRGKTLDFIYVKRQWRGIGIASGLLPPFDTVSHLTTPGKAILKEKFPKVIFDPFCV